MKAPTKLARRLRRNQTEAEKKLWFQLRDRRLGGWKFKRPCPVDRFIVDFLCADANLIIELDGGQHAVRARADARRTEILESLGYMVLRYWNNDVMVNIEGVVEDIATMLQSHGLEPAPPQQTQTASSLGQ
jgi:very-short-patch-repair endonuclease